MAMNTLYELALWQSHRSLRNHRLFRDGASLAPLAGLLSCLPAPSRVLHLVALASVELAWVQTWENDHDH